MIAGFFASALLALGVALIHAWRQTIRGENRQSALIDYALHGPAPQWARLQLALPPVSGVAFAYAGAYLLALPRLPGAMVAPMGWGLAVLIALNLIMMGYAKVRALPLPVPEINHQELRSRLRESGDWQRRYPTTTAAGPIRITAPPPAKPAIIHALVAVIGAWGLWGLSLSGRPGGILLFGLIISTAGLLLMRRNLVRGFSLTLDERGITDRSSFRRRRFLPWEVMTSVLVDPLGVLVSFDRSRPAFGALPLRQRVLLHSENYGTGIYVLARYLGLTPRDLADLIRREYRINTGSSLIEAQPTPDYLPESPLDDIGGGW
ncbi:hypothetical protein [Actinomyces gerencseriae]|uniref:hypothetical protein n=1 Tax=Actinomyces gerencseriae TaxID=52769 RepID=UPI00040A663F|nr:hypothetical protein [Actinomyces gerencseriae]